MATFGELREAIFKEAGVRNHFEFIELDPDYREFHQEINKAEFQLGYSPEYLLPDSPDLGSMELLSEEDFMSWMERFRKIRK